MSSGKTKIGACAVVVVAVAIQFIPVNRTNPPVRSTIDPPDEVERVLRQACWNCHSNETDWPWYAHVAPVSWYVTGHVHDGRDDLNFTDWPADDPAEARDLIEEIGEQIEADAMPPETYRWMHADARLSPEQRRILTDWSLARGGLDRLNELEGTPGGGY